MRKNTLTVSQYQQTLKFNPFNIRVAETKLFNILWESAARYELLEATADEGLQKNKDDIASAIADLIKAPEGDIKKVMDDIVKSKKPEDVDLAPIETELEKAGVKDLEEGVGLAIAIASLMPKVLELMGDATDWFRRKTNIKDDNWKKEAQEAHDKLKEDKAKLKKLEDAWKKHDKKYRGNPGPNASPELVGKYKDYLKDQRAYSGAKDAYEKAEHDYDHKYGAKFFGMTFKEAGHKLHHLYITPILGLLKALGWMRIWPQMRDKKKREHAANIIYALSLVALAGWGIWSHLAHAHSLGAYSTIATELADGVVSTQEGIEAALELAGVV